jgi:hypothetical protein
MATLVDDVLNLEKEADRIVSEAHSEAQKLEKSALLEIEEYRRSATREMERKIADFAKQSEEKYRISLAEIESDLEKQLDTVDRIPGDAIRKQLKRIFARFSEL